MDFSFQKKKNVLELVFFVAEIFNKYRNYTFFMRHPLYCKEDIALYLKQSYAQATAPSLVDKSLKIL